MAVRIQKPAVNIREKLAELERPIGINGAALMATNTPQDAFNLIGAGRRNMIINGDMRIAQRGASTLSGSNFYGSLDRWATVSAPAGNFSFEIKQDADIPGIRTYSRLTTTTATTLGANQYQLIWQPIEGNIFDRSGFGYSSAKNLYLSFWVRSSIAGPLGGCLENLSQDKAFPFEVNINSVNTWEYKTVFIPALNNGIWNPSSVNTGAYLMFSMGATVVGNPGVWRSTQTLSTPNEVKRIGVLGATLDITGVQLEVGNVATPFDHKTIVEELALCQRYYQVLMSGQYRDSWIACVRNSIGTTSISMPFKFQQVMRPTPSIASPSIGNLRVNGRYGDTALTGGTPVINDINERSAILIILNPTASGWTFNLGEALYVNTETATSNILAASSEL